jgi:metal-responsive CopG/Arc/MetJ family transcriptional regulator
METDDPGSGEKENADMVTISAKVPTSLKDEIEEYRMDREMNRSHAIRELVKDGMEAEANTLDFYGFLFYMGLILAVSAFVDAESTAGYAGLILMTMGLVLSRDRVQDLLNELRQLARTQWGQWFRSDR